MRCFDCINWGMLIGATDSFRVAKIGAGRELIILTRPAFGLIAFTYRKLKEFPKNTFGGKLLNIPNQIRDLISAIST